MKIQQLRFICEVAHQNLNVSSAAEALHTSQPGVSIQVRQLERELGMPIFERRGKRLVGITAPGRQIISMAEQILRAMDNIKHVAEDVLAAASGRLAIATTHTQACYALPPAISRFTRLYPNVRLEIHQGSPWQVAEWVVSGVSDVGIATEALDQFDELAAFPCYEWNRCVVAPKGHPIISRDPVTLEDLASYPIITYDYAVAGRSLVNKAFESHGLSLNVVLSALDSDVIKTYVELGLGIGLLAKMAYNPERDHNLAALDVSHLFEPSTTKVALRRDTFTRGFLYEFIEFFAPHLTRERVSQALG